MPEGLEYVSSWVDLEFTTCYQLMRTDDVSLFAAWVEAWEDLVDFEIVPVKWRRCGAAIRRARV